MPRSFMGLSHKAIKITLLPGAIALPSSPLLLSASDGQRDGSSDNEEPENRHISIKVSPPSSPMATVCVGVIFCMTMEALFKI